EVEGGGAGAAAAFHLGCLRALHDRDLLDHIRVVSGISGGSLLAALWAYGPKEFTDFDARTTDLLRSGLQLDIARQAFKPSAAARNLTAAARAGTRQLFTRTTQVTVARPANRTDALAAVLAHKAFGTSTLADVTHPGLDVVLTATDLATTTATAPSPSPSTSPPPWPPPPPTRRSCQPWNAPSPSNTATDTTSSSTPCCLPTAASTTTLACPSSNRDAHRTTPSTSTTCPSSSPVTPAWGNSR
ncbi:patatin-like phospholipase family protein, partial [Streptomyces sp. MBT57]|nr:patatin-like phospholipase family protein [Streptomyces sp. MBT57]